MQVFFCRFVARYGTLCLLVMTLAACQGAYYGAMEKIGVHKRDILVDRVEKARDSQVEAKQQFASALERFKSVVTVPGGTLEEKYKTLQSELEKSETKAEAVRSRIGAIEDVAEALFAEWQEELDQYNSESLRRSSKEKLQETQKQYKKLLAAMKRAEARIDPVLRPLRDQVLYLKHNLNAHAIASLKAELHSVETDVASLIREMEAAIKEADAFVKTVE